jgi:hypothetical protein
VVCCQSAGKRTATSRYLQSQRRSRNTRSEYIDVLTIKPLLLSAVLVSFPHTLWTHGSAGTSLAAVGKTIREIIGSFKRNFPVPVLRLCLCWSGLSSSYGKTSGDKGDLRSRKRPTSKPFLRAWVKDESSLHRPVAPLSVRRHR